jgi:NAD(P)-dependent dehydrogenase (short-subunit alcohol dehydrogenase family)
MRKIAVITGGGSGIGRCAALALAGSGYSVVIAGRRMDALQDVVEDGIDIEGDLFPVQTDVKDPGSVRALFQIVQKRFGRIDVLFNNAGIMSPPVLFEELTYEQWVAAVETNLTGSFLCAQEAMKIMKAQSPMGGRIINNGSISAHAPRPNSAPYTATKHAITGLTKSISLDGRKYDIACGQIDIGNAETSLASDMIKGTSDSQGSQEAEPKFELKHVAEAIIFMTNLPLDTNVQFMTVMATKMPYIGRG